MELIHKETKDGLKLLGCHWAPLKKDTCIVFTHGMYDNIIENCFIEEIGSTLSNKGYGVLFCHNRGYGVINNILVKDKISGKIKNKFIGSVYEKFGECIYDIDAWVESAKELGYSKIILASHSFGGCKNLYYLSVRGTKDIDKLLFLSLPDAVGYFNNNEKEFLEEAEERVKAGHSKDLLTRKLFDTFPISARTLYGFRRGSEVDKYPLMADPEDYGYFSTIEIPICAILASRDNVIVKTPKKDLETMKSKAFKCKKFNGYVIEGATHRYVGKEKELTGRILEWLSEF